MNRTALTSLAVMFALFAGSAIAQANDYASKPRPVYQAPTYQAPVHKTTVFVTPHTSTHRAPTYTPSHSTRAILVIPVTVHRPAYVPPVTRPPYSRGY